MRFEQINAEVLYSTDDITRLEQSDIERLKEMALDTPRQRIRLCAHPETNDSLHEMMIVHVRDVFVPPHRHVGKSESFHMIDGALDVVIFEDGGAIKDVIHLAAPGGDQAFYYRLSKPYYHTVLPTSDVVVFHEITNGPFRREDMEFAPWAPMETESSDVHMTYLNALRAKIA